MAAGREYFVLVERAEIMFLSYQIAFLFAFSLLPCPVPNYQQPQSPPSERQSHHPRIFHLSRNAHQNK